MRTNLFRLFLPIVLAFTLSQPLSAHFLFVHVVHGTDPRIELHFAESAWDFSANSQMVTILERVKTWLPSGESLKFERRPFGLVAKLTSKQLVASGSLTYGIMARGGSPFLLEYYAKGSVGLGSAGKTTKLMAEVVATESQLGRLTITVLLAGKPAAGAEVVVPMEGTFTDKMLTDANGQIEIAMPLTPLYSIRAMVAEQRDGEHDGKPFSLVKHYTTLTVHPAKVPANCDGMAWAILQDAASCCGAFVPVGKAWQGKCRQNGVSKSAVVKLIGRAGGVQQVRAAATESRAMEYPVRLLSCFADPRQLHGAAVLLASSRIATAEAYVEVPSLQIAYVVRDRHIEVVHRNGDASSDRIDVISWKMTHDERLLPETLLVTQFDHAGEIASTTIVERTYKEMESAYVPDRQKSTYMRSKQSIVQTSVQIFDVEMSASVR